MIVATHFLLFLSGTFVFAKFSRKDEINEDRIVGGKTTDITLVPYQLALFWNSTNELICGATVIGEREAVTAGHCVYGKDEKLFKVRSGSSYFNEGGTLHDVVEIRIHDKYNFPHHDVAFLRIAHAFETTEKVKAIDLAEKEPEPGAQGLVSGWGLLSNEGLLSRNLQSVEIPILERGRCLEIYGPSVATPDVICAGNLKGGENSCGGDSGGPLVVDRKLVGIVSFTSSKGCAQPDYSSGYANVAHLRNWLLDAFDRRN